jgi:hypothetical protein
MRVLGKAEVATAALPQLRLCTGTGKEQLPEEHQQQQQQQQRLSKLHAHHSNVCCVQTAQTTYGLSAVANT